MDVPLADTYWSESDILLHLPWQAMIIFIFTNTEQMLSET